MLVFVVSSHILKVHDAPLGPTISALGTRTINHTSNYFKNLELSWIMFEIDWVIQVLLYILSKETYIQQDASGMVGSTLL